MNFPILKQFRKLKNRMNTFEWFRGSLLLVRFSQKFTLNGARALVHSSANIQPNTFCSRFQFFQFIFAIFLSSLPRSLTFCAEHCLIIFSDVLWRCARNRFKRAEHKEAAKREKSTSFVSCVYLTEWQTTPVQPAATNKRISPFLTKQYQIKYQKSAHKLVRKATQILRRKMQIQWNQNWVNTTIRAKCT